MSSITRKDGEVLVVVPSDPPVKALSQRVRLAPMVNEGPMSTGRPKFWTGTRAFDTVASRFERFSAGSEISALLRDRAAHGGGLTR